MSTILQLMVATSFIAAMILLRVIMDRESQNDGKCEQAGCCRGCNVDEEPGTSTSRGA